RRERHSAYGRYPRRRIQVVPVQEQHVGHSYAHHGGRLALRQSFFNAVFFDGEPLDCDLFRAQAKQYGFNEEAYLAALRAVPRLSREAVNTGMAFMMKLAHMLSQTGYNNLKLARSLQDTKQAEARATERETEFHALFNQIPLSVA